MVTLAEVRELAAEGAYPKALEAGLELFEESEDESPEDRADVLIFLGAVYSALDQLPEAKYCYQSAHKLNPEHPKIQIAMSGLGGVSATPPRGLGGASADDDAEDAEFISSLDGENFAPPNADPWETAFPVDPETPQGSGMRIAKLFVALIVVVAIGWILYQMFAPLPDEPSRMLP